MTVNVFAVCASAEGHQRSVDAGYALLLSPNQTPYRDMYFLEKLSGLGENDGVQVNAVFTQLFFMMGLWPAIYAALLIPSARSGNKVRRHCHPCSITGTAPAILVKVWDWSYTSPCAAVIAMKRIHLNL